MKTNKYFVRLAICCQLLLALYACENNDWIEEGTTCNVVIARTEGGDEDGMAPLTSLSYTLCVFRAKVVEGKNLKNADYKCWKLQPGLTKDQVDSYSIKIENQDIGDYEYRLFIHATATRKDNEEKTETTETTVLGVEKESAGKEGSSYEAIEIGMVMKGDSYIPLSKDNYYASANLTTKDMIDGVTSVKLSLKRLVGQLVFDFFKSDKSGEPMDIEGGCLSTLDRVSHIKVQVQGMTSKIKLAGMVATEDKRNQILHKFDTELNDTEGGDYRLDAEKQNPENIIKIEEKEYNKKMVTFRGGARVFSVHLLPTVTATATADPKEVTKNNLKANLTFSYYDTPVLNGTPIKKELKLQLPSTQNGVLTVKENCYTLTNVRLNNNRIIDLNASGEVDIDTKWDEWKN